jgi:hypothetical protein
MKTPLTTTIAVAATPQMEIMLSIGTSVPFTVRTATSLSEGLAICGGSTGAPKTSETLQFPGQYAFNS